jgi:3D (Asp-Asp-Asp) domain-containing protein
MQIRIAAASLLLIAALGIYPAKAQAPTTVPAPAPAASGWHVVTTTPQLDPTALVSAPAHEAAERAFTLKTEPHLGWYPQLFQKYQASHPAVASKRPAPVHKKVAAARPAHLRSIHVMATAYALHGRTAHGTYTEHGTIAVDPRVIPMGTRIYVPGYGWGRALDTGGAIKGNVIDLWMPSVSQCMSWGVRQIEIMVDDGRATHQPAVAAATPPAHRALLASRSGRLDLRHKHDKKKAQNSNTKTQNDKK